MRWVHIVAGLMSIASGAVALAAFKGGWLHRRSGMVFVNAMFVMTSTAVVSAALKQPHPGNIVAGLLTFYLVATAVLTVRRPRQHARRVDIIALFGALAIASASIALGVFLDVDPRTAGDVPPRGYYFVFGTIATLFAVGDIRMLAAGGLQGAARLKRHLGRMGIAMFIATGSLFLGQPTVFAGGPFEPLGRRAIPVLAVITVTVYWRVRVSWRPRAVAPQVSRTA